VFDDEFDVHPRQEYVNHYNLQIKVTAGENQVKLFHQAFCKWYLKVSKVDAQVAIYPWAEKIRDEEDLIIENLMDIPMALPLLKKFVHKLFLHTMGGAYHIQVLLGTKVELSMVMETIGWWLKSTMQGMWKTDLQSAKEMLCAGWLLYSVEEYDHKALCKEIWNLRVQIMLRFQAINNGTKKTPKQKHSG